MKLTGNTILVTGGGSGIGRALAEALHAEGNRVVIAGRRREALAEATKATPGLHALVVDVDDPRSLEAAAKTLERDHPQLNVLVNNAGIMQPEDLLKPDLAAAEAMLRTNLLGPMRVTAALLPQLRRQPRSTIINVTSGLAFLPLAGAPTYCATKAGLHSWTESLRWQLRSTTTEVVELPPPYVQTHLGGAQQAEDPRAMPLAEFTAEVMALLRSKPGAPEVLVERVKGLRFAAEKGAYDATFQGFNEAMSGPH